MIIFIDAQIKELTYNNVKKSSLHDVISCAENPMWFTEVKQKLLERVGEFIKVKDARQTTSQFYFYPEWANGSPKS